MKEIIRLAHLLKYGALGGLTSGVVLLSILSVTINNYNPCPLAIWIGLCLADITIVAFFKEK